MLFVKDTHFTRHCPSIQGRLAKLAIVPLALTLALYMPLGMSLGVLAEAHADNHTHADLHATPHTEAWVVGDAVLPAPLSDADSQRYRQIFALQQEKKWEEADAVIASLDDDMLLGRVLAQRYLHPTGWRSKYKELSAWLAQYNDHPSAIRLYRLAKKRRPSKATPPTKPKEGYLHGFGRSFADGGYVTIPTYTDNRLSVKRTRSVVRRVRNRIRTGWPTGAKIVLGRKDSRKYLTKYEEALLRVDIAHGYFIYGKEKEAIAQAEHALRLAGDKVPRAYWVAGIAAWRMGNLTQASHYMHTLADKEAIDNSALSSAAAFWASRADGRAGDDNRSLVYLQRAAQNQDSFYGMLAAEALGADINLDFSLPSISQEYIDWLDSIPGGRRAFALLQLGESYHAARELRYLWEMHADEDAKVRLMTLAAHTHMAGLAFRIANVLREETSTSWHGGLYPIPDFTTTKPIRVDQALLISMIRQESGFNPRARSWAKASGLMQLMPSTAAYIARDRGYRYSKRHDLLLPNINIKLGEDYILYLLKKPIVDKDMLRLLAAYNAGWGNLKKWTGRISYDDDALMLLESLPSRETRYYVKNVMRNLWIYSKRLGYATPAVAKLAAGEGAPIDNRANKRRLKKCPITNLSQVCTP